MGPQDFPEAERKESLAAVPLVSQGSVSGRILSRSQQILRFLWGAGGRGGRTPRGGNLPFCLCMSPFLASESFSEDEWNLLYVAVTRARKRLIMTKSLENILTLAGVRGHAFI